MLLCCQAAAAAAHADAAAELAALGLHGVKALRDIPRVPYCGVEPVVLACRSA